MKNDQDFLTEKKSSDKWGVLNDDVSVNVILKKQKQRREIESFKNTLSDTEYLDEDNYNKEKSQFEEDTNIKKMVNITPDIVPENKKTFKILAKDKPGEILKSKNGEYYISLKNKNNNYRWILMKK